MKIVAEVNLSNAHIDIGDLCMTTSGHLVVESYSIMIYLLCAHTEYIPEYSSHKITAIHFSIRFTWSSHAYYSPNIFWSNSAIHSLGIQRCQIFTSATCPILMASMCFNMVISPTVSQCYYTVIGIKYRNMNSFSLSPIKFIFIILSIMFV